MCWCQPISVRVKTMFDPCVPASLPTGVSMSRPGSEAALFITVYRTHLPHSGAIILTIKWSNAPCQSHLLKY